jgi:hypothetical protein
MKNTVWPFAVIGLLLIVGGCAGTSTGFGVYGSPGYYPGPYYDSFWGSPFPRYYSPYNPYPFGPAFGAFAYPRPFYYPRAYSYPYRPSPYRYGWAGPRRHYRR